MSKAIKFYKGESFSSYVEGGVYFEKNTGLIKVGTSTSTADIFGGDVKDATFADNKLTISFNSGKANVVLDFSDVASAEATKSLLSTLRDDINALQNDKVDKVEGSRLMTETEGTKLAGVEEGAQVNKIETVKVNGTALTITDKAVNVTIPAADEYSIVKATESGDYAAVYNLTKNGSVVGDTINIAKDKVLQNVELINTAEEGVTIDVPYLKFTFQNVDTPIRVSMKEFMDDTNIVTSVAAASGETLITVTPTTGDVKISASSDLTSAVSKANTAVQDANYAHITVTATSVSDGTTTFNQYVHPTTTAVAAAAVKVGNDASGHVVLGDALTAKDANLASDYAAATSYVAPKAGDSVQTAIAALAAGVDAASKGGVLSVTGEAGTLSDGFTSDYVQAFVNTNQITGAVTLASVEGIKMQAMSSASSTAKGVAEASDVKDYVDNAIAWVEFA